MKTKLMKKMIALICAAAMTTSCATVSVGAVKYGYGCSMPSDEIFVYQLDNKIRLSINTIGEMTKKINEIKGKKEYTDYILSHLNAAKELLESTDGLEIAGNGMMESIESVLDNYVAFTINTMNGYFSEYSNDPKRLLTCLYDDCEELGDNVKTAVRFIKRSDELSKKYRELGKVKSSIKQINNSKEYERLEKLCEDAKGAYMQAIQGKAACYRKQKDELVNLANSAILEIKKALDAQKEEENKRKEEEKKREFARKREQLKKEMEREDREREEKRKQEELAAKKQEKELANRKLKLQQQEIRLQKELEKLDKQARKFGNLKLIYDGWYDGDQLPVIRCLIEIDYKLEEVRGELNDMNIPKINMPKMFINMKSGSNRQKEKELVRKKFEINQKYVNLSNELKNIEYLSSLGIDDFDSKEIESQIIDAETRMMELNRQIREEIENRNKNL